MSRLRRWSLYLAAICVLLAAPASAPLAQSERAPLTGIIDIQAVLRESAAVQSLSQAVERQRQSVQEEMAGRERELRAADSDLAQRRSSLSPDAYAKERAQLEQKAIELQREAQAQRRSLDQMFSRGMSQVQEVLLQISQNIARENNLDLVLAKTTVIIVRPEFDYTQEALQRLNAQLPEAALPAAPN